MQQHTPGPWEVQQPGTITLSVAAENKTYPICIVYKYLFVDQEAMANANLIAAAPELLEALDRLLAATVDEDLKYGISLTEQEQEARAFALEAIAKAVGE